MFSWLFGLNTWLQRSCGIKGANFNIFWGHRQQFKLDGLHQNKLCARLLKDDIYFSFHHPSVVCTNPLGRNGTNTPGKSMSDHRTSYLLQSRHVVDTSHKDTDKNMQLNNHCSWTSRLSPTHRAHHKQIVTYYNSSETQHPRTTSWKTAREARTTFHSHQKHQSQIHRNPVYL